MLAIVGRRQLEVLVGLAVVILAVYFPILNASYLPWDDDEHIFFNTALQNFQLMKFWLAPYYSEYVPLTMTFWSVLYKIGHGNVVPFRVFSLMLHFANCVLLFKFLTFLQAKRGAGSFASTMFGVLIFAVHPMQVESIAWISGARDLLSTAFALLCLNIYFSDRSKAYGWASLCLVLALLSKSSAVVVPCVVVCIAWILDRKKIMSHLRKMIPWFSISSLFIFVASYAQKGISLLAVPWWFRPLNALDSFGFYLEKLIWPWPIAVDYGRTPAVLLESPKIMMATIALCLVVAGLLLWRARKDRWFHFAWVWFLILLPVSGIVAFGFQENSTVSDHYLYFAMFAVSALVCLVVPSRLAVSLGLIVTLVFGVASNARAKVWTDRRSFFQDMYDKNPHSFAALVGITMIYFDAKDFTNALVWTERAIEERPLHVIAAANFAAVLNRLGRHAEVIALNDKFKFDQFQRSAQFNPFPTSELYASMASSAAFSSDRPLTLKFICAGAKYVPNDPKYKIKIETAENYAGAKCPSN